MPGQWSSLFSRSFHEKMALMLWSFVSDFVMFCAGSRTPWFYIDIYNYIYRTEMELL